MNKKPTRCDFVFTTRTRFWPFSFASYFDSFIRFSCFYKINLTLFNRTLKSQALCTFDLVRQGVVMYNCNSGVNLEYCYGDYFLINRWTNRINLYYSIDNSIVLNV